MLHEGSGCVSFFIGKRLVFTHEKKSNKIIFIIVHFKKSMYWSP